MGKSTGLLEVKRQEPQMRAPEERVKDFKENTTYRLEIMQVTRRPAVWTVESLFVIRVALWVIEYQNLMMLFTEVILRRPLKCFVPPIISRNYRSYLPAPCESSCVLGINDNPVTIEFIEEGN